MVSPAGESSLFFTQGTPLAEPTGSNGTYDQYESARTAQGWRILRRLSPSGAQAVFPNAGGVSPDHEYDFYNVGPVNGGEGGSLADEGEANYLGSPDGSFGLLGVGDLGVERLAEGRFISSHGSHVVFTTGGPRCGGGSTCEIKQLEPDAPETGTPTVYERSANGPTRVVSLLPDGNPPNTGEAAEYQGTSADGTAIAFDVGGTLYVRSNGASTEEVASGGPTFAGIEGEGAKVFYVLGGDVFAFEVGSEATTQVTSTGDALLVNISRDGSHVYFISSSQIGGEGTLGENNLYVWDAGTETTAFIAPVSPVDAVSEPPSGQPSLATWTTRVVHSEGNGNDGPGADPSRTTPDGSVLVFESHAQLTGYETNGHDEIYRYDAGEPSLACVSCNPRTTSASGDARLEAIDVEAVSSQSIVHNLSEDGSKVIFETEEALVERDVDGINDIYEWNGEGEPALALISSGETNPFRPGATTNVIFGITPSQRDVVFGSLDALVPSAPGGGAQEIYDARAGGGFAEPPPPPPCSGDDCQGPAGAGPTLTPPGSESLLGEGNVKAHRHRCPVGHHRAKRKRRHRTCRGRHRRAVAKPRIAVRGGAR